MRKITAAAAAILGVALLVTGCSSSGGGTAATTEAAAGDASDAPAVRGDQDLVIWTAPDRVDYIKPLADKFAEANGISVGVQGIVDTRQNFITANAAGNGPDVVVGAHDWIGQLVQNGAIDPLQIKASDLSGYLPVAVQATTYNGQLYSLPWAVESVAMYCNTKYAPDTYATLDDMLAAAQPLVDAGTLQVPLIDQQGEQGDAYHMQPLFTSAGGYIFGRNADGSYNQADLGLSSPQSVAAAQKIATLGANGDKTLSTSISGDNYLSLFTSGKAACMISGPWSLPDVKKSLAGSYSIQPVPPFAGGQTAQPFMGAQGFMIAANGKNKSFAQEFVTKFLNDADSMQALYDASNQPPAMQAVLDKVTDKDVLDFEGAVANAAPMPAIPAMAEVFAPLGLAWAAIIGGADPTSTMDTTQTTIATAIGNK